MLAEGETVEGTGAAHEGRGGGGTDAPSSAAANRLPLWLLPGGTLELLLHEHTLSIMPYTRTCVIAIEYLRNQ